MTPTQALKHALDLEQERSRTLEAVVKALQTELKAEKVKATTLQAQLDELHQAARALVEAFEDQEGSRVVPCLCGGLATTFDNGGKTRCDVHPNGGEDLTYAPAWRRLCALVEGK